MIPSDNPLINWLRFCRWMSVGRFCLTASVFMWAILFINGISPVGFLMDRQMATLAISAFILLAFSSIKFLFHENDGYSRFWEKRNARYQKLIDEIEALEREDDKQ